MSLRLYLFGLATISVSALCVWLWILFGIDPVVATQFDFVLFYSSLFLWLAGALTLLGYSMRLLKSHNEYYYGNLLTSLRQGSLISGYLSLLLVLQGGRILRLGEALLLLAAIVLFELYFLAKQ